MLAQHLDSVEDDVIGEVARHAFGSSAEVLTSELLGAGSGNLAYLVALRGEPRRFVFRFNRGFRDDVYESEAANYRMVAAATGVRVPEIVTIDRRRELSPTSYMVMEYLTGQDWTVLCAGDNPATSARQKDDIRRAAGRFYADLHAVTRPATAGESVATIAMGLAQFSTAVREGHLDVDLDKVAACERVVAADGSVQSSTLSLCMSDGEMFFDERAGTYELAFVCDLEWVGFGNRLADLSGQALPGRRLWALDIPVAVAPDTIHRDPFFQAYAESADVDVDAGAVGRLALYSQLSMWGTIAAEVAPPEKKRWIREQKLPLINELIELVSQA